MASKHKRKVKKRIKKVNKTKKKPISNLSEVEKEELLDEFDD